MSELPERGECRHCHEVKTLVCFGDHCIGLCGPCVFFLAVQKGLLPEAPTRLLKKLRDVQQQFTELSRRLERLTDDFWNL